MYYVHRYKFSASIVSGSIVPDTAEPGFLVLNAGGIGSKNWAYLLEDGAGVWEIGYQPGSGSLVAVESSAGSFAVFGANVSNLTCTLIVPASGYVACGPQASPNSAAFDAPFAQYADSLAIGRGSGAGAPRTIAIGVDSGTKNPVDCDESVIIGYRAYSEKKMSSAIGYLSKPAHDGENVIGSHYTSHISSIAVKTDDLSAGGTGVLKSIAAVDAYAEPTTLSTFSAGVAGPYNNVYATYMIRVLGTIYAKSSNVNDLKIFNVDYMTYDGASIYSNITALFTGSNAPAITLTVNASEQLEISVPALTGLQISGVLRVDKLLVKA